MSSLSFIQGDIEGWNLIVCFVTSFVNLTTTKKRDIWPILGDIVRWEDNLCGFDIWPLQCDIVGWEGCLWFEAEMLWLVNAGWRSSPENIINNLISNSFVKFIFSLKG